MPDLGIAKGLVGNLVLLEAFANHFSRVFFKVKFPGLVLELDFPGRGLMQDEFIAAVFELFTGDRTQVFHGIDHPKKGAGIEEELHRLRGKGLISGGGEFAVEEILFEVGVGFEK